MKNLFVETSNVLEFMNTAKSLESAEAGVPGLALVWGQRGLGKTRTAKTLYARCDWIYLRGVSVWTPSWMLDDLAVDLGLVPKKRKADNFRDIINVLRESPRLIIIDELNVIPTDCVEAIRDLHDVSGNPFLLIGHEGVVDRMKRMGPFFDRFLYITEFKPLTEADLGQYCETCMDLPVSDAAITHVLARTAGNFRKSIVMLKGAEDRARVNRSKAIEPGHFCR